MHIVADLYAEVLGVVAQSRYSTLSDYTVCVIMFNCVVVQISTHEHVSERRYSLLQ